MFPEGNYGITGDTSIGAPSWTSAVDSSSVFDYNQVSKTQTLRKITYPGTNNTVGTVTLDPTYIPLVTMTGHDGNPVGVNIPDLQAAILGLDLTK